MQASPTTPTIFLPDEIIFYILHSLDPCEVIRLRRVSRQFNGVTRDARLWRALYTNSHLPRPSGPFLWQSTQFLEHALVHSARLSRTWTSQPICVVSRVRGPRMSAKLSPVSTSFDFLFGRLFIWCEGEQLLAQDIETGVGRLLWESTGPISSLNACSLTLPDAERVFIALRYVDEPIDQRTPMHVHFLPASFFLDPDVPLPRKLLEFPIQDDVRLTLGPVTFEMDLPAYANFPLFASAPFLYFDGGIDRLFGHLHESMVIDARTRAMYTFPMFSCSLDAVIHREPRPWWPGFTLPSRKHILVFRYFQHWDPPMTLIQAFVAPDPSAHLSDADTDQLCLSHEVLADYCYMPTHQLRDPIVDPVTGETNIRLLSTDTLDGRTHFLCVDITIPPINSGSMEVLPMFVTAQELFARSGWRQTVFFGASNDGHGRGMFTMCSSDTPVSGHYPLVVYKFSIDASGEHCTAAVSESSSLTLQDVLQNANCCIFDGATGRLCHGVEEQYKWDESVVLGLH